MCFPHDAQLTFETIPFCCGGIMFENAVVPCLHEILDVATLRLETCLLVDKL